MNSADAISIFNTMTSQNVLYAFHGEFNYKMVNTLLSDVKKELHKTSNNITAAKKTYKVLVECLENIHKHSARKENEFKDNNEGIFILSKNDDGYKVAIGNSILDEEVSTLQVMLDEINSMDPDALKSRYREQIRNTEVSDKGGAGLGMIDIAIKSGSILDYKFDNYTNTKHFFSLEILIKA
ncbi:MAG: hypothetical protein H6600_04605 [Flavobacteriales bacterium]|nr:hypothetical protein [Flavobacteriales bacterium]MCB9197716.1 hypothetical protein [Flavobacteriales bacterium]